MTLTIFGSNIVKIGSQPGLVLIQGFQKANRRCVQRISSANITSKVFKENRPKPAPYPYKEKNYPLWRSWFDKTTHRFDENSKIIVVEGPVAIGKTKFAKQLADDLDMHHIEEANMDIRYINSCGFDLRQLDDKLPESVQSYDEKKFCKNPHHINSAAFQIWMYRLRYSLYIDALAHLLSTGQGVVIERSPWSDKVFVEAMAKNKFISSNAKRGYNEVKKNTIRQLLKPHLIVYLDAPVSKIQENIKKRGLPHEQNSPALTDNYLQDIEDSYKTDYLVKMSEHSELLMYDWSQEGDVEAVVEDIERIDFDSYTKHDSKLHDWCIHKENYWGELRMRFADDKQYLMNMFNVPFLDAPELLAPGEDIEIYFKVANIAPGNEYAEGFNPKQGDTNLLFKTRDAKYIKF